MILITIYVNVNRVNSNAEDFIMTFIHTNKEKQKIDPDTFLMVPYCTQNNVAFVVLFDENVR